MDIRQLERDTRLILLPAEPQLRREIAGVRRQLERMRGSHLIVDFSRVEIITSPSIGDLLLLQKVVLDRGGRMICCNLRFVTKCILRTVGLDLHFEFAEDKPKALQTLHQLAEAPAGAQLVSS